MSDQEPAEERPRDDTPVRTGIVWAVAAGLLAAVVIVLVATGLLGYRGGGAKPPDRSAPPRFGSEKALAPTPHESRAKMNSYGWVDRKEGIVSIPIDEAMKRVVADYQSRPPRGEESTNATDH